MVGQVNLALIGSLRQGLALNLTSSFFHLSFAYQTESAKLINLVLWSPKGVGKIGLCTSSWCLLETGLQSWPTQRHTLA
jgi:hypothetical protein